MTAVEDVVLRRPARLRRPGQRRAPVGDLGVVTSRRASPQGEQRPLLRRRQRRARAASGCDDDRVADRAALSSGQFVIVPPEVTRGLVTGRVDQIAGSPRPRSTRSRCSGLAPVRVMGDGQPRRCSTTAASRCSSTSRALDKVLDVGRPGACCASTTAAHYPDDVIERMRAMHTAEIDVGRDLRRQPAAHHRHRPVVGAGWPARSTTATGRGARAARHRARRGPAVALVVAARDPARRVVAAVPRRRRRGRAWCTRPRSSRPATAGPRRGAAPASPGCSTAAAHRSPSQLRVSRTARPRTTRRGRPARVHVGAALKIPSTTSRSDASCRSPGRLRTGRRSCCTPQPTTRRAPTSWPAGAAGGTLALVRARPWRWPRTRTAGPSCARARRGRAAARPGAARRSGSGQTVAAQPGRELRELTAGTGPVAMISEHRTELDGADGSVLDRARRRRRTSRWPSCPCDLTCFFPELPLHQSDPRRRRGAPTRYLLVGGSLHANPATGARARSSPSTRSPHPAARRARRAVSLPVRGSCTRRALPRSAHSRRRRLRPRPHRGRRARRQRGRHQRRRVRRHRTPVSTSGSTATATDGAVCEMHDRGTLRDPLPGLAAPHSSEPRGRGVWIARQICESLHVWSDRSGTHVRLHAGRPGMMAARYVAGHSHVAGCDVNTPWQVGLGRRTLVSRLGPLGARRVT